MNRRAKTGTLISGLVLGGMLLTACASGPVHGPQIVAPVEITTSGASSTRELPLGATHVRNIKVETRPEAVGEVFLGFLLPSSDKTDLTLVAFDENRTRWSLRTNPACGGWAATSTVSGEQIVVALNSDARVERGKLANNTSASAFEADGGSPVWEGMPVFGPLSSQSLVFTGVQSSVVVEEPIPRMTIHPDTGDRLNVPEPWSGNEVVHEHYGTVVLAHAEQLLALNAHTGETLWKEDESNAKVSQSTQGHALVVQDRDEAAAITLVHAMSGEPIPRYASVSSIATSADGAFTVVSGADAAGTYWVAGLNDEGVMWEREVTDNDAQVSSVHSSVMFLHSENERIMLNTRNGIELQRGDFIAPVAINTEGAALIPTKTSDQYEVIELDTDRK